MTGGGAKRAGGLLAVPLVGFMLVFYALPVVAMLLRSVTEPGFGLQNYALLFADSVFARVLGNTLQTAGVVTGCTLLLGYPVAYAMSRMKPRLAAAALVVVLLPFWTSVLVRSYAWMVLLGRRGVVNEGLSALGLIEAPLKLLNTPLAVDIAMVHILLPYMVLPIANALRQIDVALPRAAAGLGAGRGAVFLQVVLPLSAPGVASGVLLVFVLSLGFYITPALVGGPRDIMLSMLIAQQVELLNWAYASCLAAVLLAVTLAILGGARLLPGVGQSLRAGMR